MKSETGKPALLMVGHMYATAFNRRKLNPLVDFFEVTCVTWQLEDSELFGRPLVDFEEADHEARYELIRLPRIPRRAAITRYLHRGLAEVLRVRPFDVVLVDSEPWGWIRWQAWALSRLIQPEAVFGEFTWENVERPSWKGLVLGWVYRLACATHDFSISGNQACRKILQRYGMRPDSNLVAAQLGVALSEFRPAGRTEKQSLRAELGLPTKGLIIGFCGRFASSKGVPELVEAIESLREKYPDMDLCLALLGQGELRPMLEAAAATRPWLRLLAPRPHREVAPFMRSLDVFVLPSKPVRNSKSVWEEQFGHVLIEAMAAEVATFGSSSGAIPEVIGMPEAVFDHSNLDSLVTTLGHWLSRPSELEQLAIRQRQRVEDEYSHEALARVWGHFLVGQWERARQVDSTYPLKTHG